MLIPLTVNVKTNKQKSWLSHPFKCTHKSKLLHDYTKSFTAFSFCSQTQDLVKYILQENTIQELYKCRIAMAYKTLGI